MTEEEQHANQKLESGERPPHIKNLVERKSEPSRKFTTMDLAELVEDSSIESSRNHNARIKLRNLIKGNDLSRQEKIRLKRIFVPRFRAIISLRLLLARLLLWLVAKCMGKASAHYLKIYNVYSDEMRLLGFWADYTKRRGGGKSVDKAVKAAADFLSR